jgi:hypothetical protein
MKASTCGLPFYKLKVGPCGSHVSAEYLGICQSQACLPLQPKKAFLYSMAFDLLQLALRLGALSGLGEQLGSRNGEGESGRLIAGSEFSSEINFFRRTVIVSLRD